MVSKSKGKVNVKATEDEHMDMDQREHEDTENISISAHGRTPASRKQARASVALASQANTGATAPKCKGRLPKLAQRVEMTDAGAHKLIMYAVRTPPSGLRSFATPEFGKKKPTPLRMKKAADNSIPVIDLSFESSSDAENALALKHVKVKSQLQKNNERHHRKGQEKGEEVPSRIANSHEDVN
ncbi:uncharacterized protein LAESUDRAFT_758782 [Laetiporus sulphureus 93-53]|uniref:Uncharacterized protein n=1 Tax=Laetiporus sulphureus 93-53 TaxID=1314785 RepID=A0A165EFQ6_9APHY|nr:uncharacterized protein LAESUDRAFT_758782 [Laetiporus sulphureus 93-53]KZT06965.1 hypothetical protein LAESUDRAFT_758782 [Laetiporus sulphureus 93-53]